MFDNQKAADELEELAMAAKEIVRLLRADQTRSKNYAMIHELRRRISCIVREMGEGSPSTSARQFAEFVIDSYTWESRVERLRKASE